MAITKYIGTGAVDAADFREISWVGLTKGGNAVTIKLHNAINMGNIDWTFAEKNDVVPSIEFTACYENTDSASDSTLEPFEIEVNGTVTSGASEIILGAGKFYIDGTLVALTRGGGQFTVEREFREINADGDRGPVKDRVVIDASRATLTVNALTFLTSMTNVFAGISATT